MQDPPEVLADLIELVKDHDRIAYPDLPYLVDDPSRHSSRVGLPMSPDLGLVLDPAKGDPDKLPAERARNGAAKGCFARTGRTGEAKHGTAGILAHDPLLQRLIYDISHII